MLAKQHQATTNDDIISLFDSKLKTGGNMATVQIASRVDKDQAEKFKKLTKQLGTTPADAIRMFIASFNMRGGFPYDVRAHIIPEPFETEEEAMDFIRNLTAGVLENEPW